VQHCRRLDRRRRGVDRDQIAQSVEQSTGHLDADSRSIGLAYIGERTLDLAAEVPGDPVGSLGRVECTLVGRQGVGQCLQSRPEPFGDEDLVQARRQFLHGPERYELSRIAAGITLGAVAVIGRS
jgi:hypothetical protein